ncbi:hypothetical protein ANO11243_050120 [Dothideomycetidae sp. 11243]|nr:hypothetical protein ANO11243_050120 [fungal sp. No.11243]
MRSRAYWIFVALCTLCSILVFRVFWEVRVHFNNEPLFVSHALDFADDDDRRPLGESFQDESACAIESVPYIIHQTYKTAQIPEQWLEAQHSCQKLHQTGWQHMFWTDEDADNFLAIHYPWFLPTYRAYPYDIQRADVIRYFVLYHFGGVYLDLDVGCQKPLDPLLAYGALLPKTLPVGVSNDVMISPARHPFFAMVIEDLLHDDSIYWGPKYSTVLFSTGSMFVTMEVSQYWKEQTLNSSYDTSQSTNSCLRDASVLIIPTRYYEADLDSFFLHFPGSSWHSVDVRVVSYIITKKEIFLLLSVLALALGALIRIRLRGRAIRPSKMTYHEMQPM